MRATETDYVSSSHIGSLKYDYRTNILTIYFLSRAVYQYMDVSERIWRSLQAAPSKGKFCNRFIYYSYSFRRVQ